MFCPKCGKELAKDATYCHNCGTRVGGPSPTERWEWSRERRWGRDGRSSGSWWGLVNFFGFLIIVGLTISRYPNVFFLITRYFETWGTLGYPILPGYALGRVIIFFFTISGVWGLVSAGLRFAFTNSLSKPMRDIVGALFALYIANSFSLYYGGMITGTALVLAFFVGLAIVIIANALIAFYVPRRLTMQRNPL